MNTHPTAIVKPNRYLLHPMSLSSSALNVLAVLIMQIKDDFHHQFYSPDLENGIQQIDTLLNEIQIKSKIKKTYSISTNQLQEITGLSISTIRRQIVINESSNKKTR